MDTVGTVLTWVCLAVIALGLGFIAEDEIKHWFGWGCYRDPTKHQDQERQERGDRLVREAEALVADRAARLRHLYD